MEDLHMNNTSQDYSSDYTNCTYDYNDYNDSEWKFSMYVFTSIVIGLGLPLTLMAIYALYCQVRNGQVAPIYVINLLITDLIQFCCFIVWVTPSEDERIQYAILLIIYNLSLGASVGFMVCVALERLCVHLVLQVFGHCLATVVPLQTNHQDLCGGLCRGLDLSSCLSPHF
ncbi:G-protein coupled receptor 4 [Nibea albiflora]|uniref:G-protein coupled receptor 4 n=1 Tax=Nibea albiflora TaxID=240163 RepID=A0ACB7EEJ8_NIBAL|nr:G-protein coupled receptor 4 [Nibea albiflora]